MDVEATCFLCEHSVFVGTSQGQVKINKYKLRWRAGFALAAGKQIDQRFDFDSGHFRLQNRPDIDRPEVQNRRDMTYYNIIG